MSLIKKLLIIGIGAFLALSCGGGGGSDSANNVGFSSQGKLKARFAASKLFNVLEGDRLILFRLGETTPYFEEANLAQVAELEVEFELEKNYVLAVERLGVRFLSMIITSSQIDQAIDVGVLKLGDLNAVTTFLTHKIAPQSAGLTTSQQGELIQRELDIYLSGVSDFSQLILTDLFSKKVVLNDFFYKDLASRVNAMTTFSALLRENVLRQKNSLADQAAMQDLHAAILEGNVEAWVDASGRVQTSLPTFSSLTDFESLNISDKLFKQDGRAFYVIDEPDLYEIFFAPSQAENLFLYDLAVRTPESVISGKVSGSGASGTTVYLQRPSKDGNSWVTQETQTLSDGSFEFKGLEKDDAYRLVAKKSGHFFQESSRNKVGDLIDVQIVSFALADNVDDTTVGLDGSGKLSIKDGGVGTSKIADANVTSAKLTDDISIRGNFSVTGSTNLGGIVFPNSTGTNGQFLVTDGVGQLSWMTPSAGSSLGVDSVGSTEIAADAVGASEIAAGAVGSSELANNSVSTATLADLSVSTDKLADSAITSAKLASSISLQDLAVSNSANIRGILMPAAGSANQILGYNEVGALVWKTISTNSITTTVSLSANESITGNWENTANPWSVNEGGTGAGTAAGARTNLGLGDMATQNNTAVDINGGAIDGATINGFTLPTVDGTDGQVLKTDGSKVLSWVTPSSGGASLSADSVNSTHIAADAVGASEIAADAVGSSEIAANAVTSSEIVDGSVTSTKLASSISIADLVTTSSANLGGVLIPSAGSANQILGYNETGDLVWKTISTNSISTSVSLSANESITGDWNNTANPWAVNEGGTGAGTVAGARTNLGLGDVAVQNKASIDITGGTMAGVVITGGNINGFTLPTVDGTTGQVLQTDGSRVLSWVTATASSSSNTIAGLTFPGTVGSANQVLVSDAAGNLQWADQSGGGASLTTDSVTATHIAADAVGSSEIAASAVTSSELADGSVTTAKLGTVVISSANIGTDAVTATHIAADAVGSSEIAASAVTSSELADGSVTTAKLGTVVVSSANIGTDAVTATHIAADAVGSSEIAASAVTSSELADGSVTTAKLGTVVISSANIGTDAVTATHIAADAVGSSEIAASAVTSSELADGSVTTAKLGTVVISSANIGTDAVTATHIAVDAVGASEIAADSITTSELADGAVNTANLGTVVISSDNIGSGIITPTHLSTSFVLASSNIGAGSITSAKLDDDISVTGNLTVGTNIVVTGSANLSGLMFPSSDGAASTVLTTAGNGTLSWTPVNTVLNAGTVSSLTITTADINGGTIDGTVIGGATAAAATFTDVSVKSALYVASNVHMSDNLFVAGNTFLGDDFANDTLSIEAVVNGGGTAGGNVWFTGNIIAQSNIYSLGTATTPWREIFADDLVTTSDERLKQEVEPLDYGLDDIMKLRPVSYTWSNKPNKGRTIGLMAQELEQVITEVVSVGSDSKNTRGVKYGNIVPVLIKAIQEQQNVIDSQKELLERQMDRIDALEQKVIEK